MSFLNKPINDPADLKLVGFKLPSGIYAMTFVGVTEEERMQENEDHPYFGKTYTSYKLQHKIVAIPDTKSPHLAVPDEGILTITPGMRKELVMSTENMKTYVGRTFSQFFDDKNAGLVYDENLKEWRLPMEINGVMEVTSEGQVAEFNAAIANIAPADWLSSEEAINGLRESGIVTIIDKWAGNSVYGVKIVHTQYNGRWNAKADNTFNGKAVAMEAPVETDTLEMSA